MSSSSFKMLVVGIFMLLFNGCLCGPYTPPEFERKYYNATNGEKFLTPVHDELIIYVYPGRGRWLINYKIIDDWKEYRNFLSAIGYFKLRYLGIEDSIVKYDIVELQPRKADEFRIDVTTFGFPTWCYYYNNEPYLKVLIHVDFMYPGANVQPNDDYFVHFVDPEDKCKDYRPTVLNETNFLNFNLLANTKSAKYAYYFIKKDNFICSYVFVYDDLFNSFYSNILEIKPVNFYLIKNYPTENYAPNFFCIDVLYGTFVSLYWNRQSPPEAHYYIINEKDLTNIKLIDKMVLNKFDENILKDIFDNKFDASFYPTFTSYGRQIFISFKLNSGKKWAFNGFWKNESEYDVHWQEFKIGEKPLVDNYDRKVFRAKKSWIQYDRPVGRESAESTPPPLPQPQPLTDTPPPAPSTTKLSTTTPPPSTTPPLTSSSMTTTVSATKIFPLTSSTIIDSSMAPSTSSPTTTSNNSNGTNNGTNSILPTPQAQNSDTTTTTSSSNEFGCFIYENLWILYLIIGVDIFEIIIIILLIVFKFRGAKKMKEAMAKKNVQKSTKKNKKKQSSQTMPIKKSSKKKKQKKSTIEKSATKTEDDGKTLIAVPKKTTTSVDQGTNYFTVNQSFDHSVQK